MKIIRINLLVILFAALLFNCGGKEEKKKEGFSYEKTSTSETSDTKSVDAKEASIVITSNDIMQFNVKEIKVKAGQKVKLTLRHIGKLDINIMGHNLVILKQGVNLAEFAAEATNFRDNKYIPTNSKDIIAHTDLIGAGQTSTIEFEAPEAGTYEFLCSFPGHFGMMQGKFIVE